MQSASKTEMFQNEEKDLCCNDFLHDSLLFKQFVMIT